MNDCESIENALISALSGNALTDRIIRQDDGLWQVFLGSELVTVEVDAASRRVNFSIESLDAFSELSSEKLILLLQYSFVWQANGGVYFSLTDNNQPVLMIYFNIDEIDDSMVRNVVLGLLEKFLMWKDILL